MHLECNKKLVKCPNRGYEFLSKAKRVTHCVKCDKSFDVKNVANATNNVANATIQQNIVNGSILDALEQAGINPLDDTKFVNDSILHILERCAVYNSVIFTIIEQNSGR